MIMTEQQYNELLKIYNKETLAGVMSSDVEWL